MSGAPPCLEWILAVDSVSNEQHTCCGHRSQTENTSSTASTAGIRMSDIYGQPGGNAGLAMQVTCFDCCAPKLQVSTEPMPLTQWGFVCKMRCAWCSSSDSSCRRPAINASITLEPAAMITSNTRRHMAAKAATSRMLP